MATTEQKNADAEVREVLARMRPLYKEFAAVSSLVTKLGADLRSFDTDLTILLNAQESLDRRRKDAETDLAKVEREAKTRLQNIEHGHRTLTDNLTRKELEAQAKMAEAEKMERASLAARNEYELLKDSYERKLAELTAAHPKAKGK